MTAYSPYQGYPDPAPPAATQPPPVFVAVADPAPQRRLTVFFRGIMIIPQLFVLYFITLAAEIVAFIGWWGALFTGRLPGFAVTFISGWLRWMNRVLAYWLLLTDVYPPFSLDDNPTYPVRLAIPAPQRLNRAAVFFRFILVIPAAFLASFVIWGAATLMAFIAWLITLVAGRLPASFHLAYAAVLRFQARYYAYYLMLTPAYPGGLYGDKPGTVSWADEAPVAQAPGFGTPGAPYAPQEMAYGTPVEGAPQGYEPASASDDPYGAGAQEAQEAQEGHGAPQDFGVPQGSGAPQGPYGPAGYGAPQGPYGPPAGYGTPGGYSLRPLFQPATWLLQLTSGARKLLTTFIALGAVVMIAAYASDALTIISASSSANNSATATTAANQLNSSYNTLTKEMTSWEQAVTNCNQDLACVTGQDAKAAKYLNTFSSQLAATQVPGSAAADKAKLSSDVTAAANDFTQLSRSASATQYQSTVSSTNVLQTLNSFDTDYSALINKLQTSY